jgi:hypothetical protein
MDMDFLGYAYMALGFVVFVVAIGIGASVLSGIQTAQVSTVAGCTQALAAGGQANCTTVAWNATGFGLTGITNLANQSGNIGLILGAVIIIGLLLSAFMVSRK